LPTQKLTGGACIRCGKTRVVIDTYEEKVETSVVTYTVTACTDSDCQKIVDKLLKDEEKKREMIKKEQEKRELLRRQAIAEKKLEKAA
jgi:hypothetical protein